MLETLEAASQDTEITLGTGKMLALFFGLVALCGVFFGMGYKLGKSSLPQAAEASPAGITTNGGSRPSAVKPTADPNANAASDVAFYKAEDSKNAAASSAPAGQPAAAPAASAPAASDGAPAAPDPNVAPPANSYYVQVAAVTKQEDADALVDALKKKQYPAFSTPLPDKLIHIQVGPFPDIKNAEDMRSRLVGDGYNPILKR